MYRIGKSNIEGEGVIASANIVKGTFLFPVTTPVPNGVGPWPYTIGVGMKLNHSYNPNVTLHRAASSEPGHYVINAKTTKHVTEDEEMTVNYDEISPLGYGGASAHYK